VRESEDGFTLVEMIIAVAIAMILLVAGGSWMMSMRPGSLRQAVNDFDSALAAARQIAATSGNGATIAFLPRADNGPGYVLRLYSGRPNAANAVRTISFPLSTSSATITEATFGAPPFVIFLSSAGYPTGMASYPMIDTTGNASFPAVASQPPCPGGGIVLTFQSPQGVRDTRAMQCNAVSVGNAAANPSPTPNAPHISPSFMLAHWTSDANPLQFKVAEFGYTHWFASNSGPSCQTIGSDTGAAPASYPSPFPYSVPMNPGEPSLAPAVPSAPYSWPNGSPDQPSAKFHMQPSVGGMCTVRIVDDYSQEVDAGLQVMGSLKWLGAPSPARLDFTLGTTPPQTLTFTKTWDSEPLQLQYGGACAGIVGVSKGGASTPASPSSTPAAQPLTITAVGSGSCVLQVGDQYGEPTISIPINITKPLSMATWPLAVQFAASGATLASTEPQTVFRVASVINAALGGATALAAPPCAAIAYKDSTFKTIDSNDTTFLAALGISTDSRGCYDGSMVAYEQAGSSTAFTFVNSSCASSSLRPTTWTGQPAISSALHFIAGSTPINSCSVTLQDGNNAGQGTSGNGLVMAQVDGCAIDTTTWSGNGLLITGATCSMLLPLESLGAASCGATEMYYQAGFSTTGSSGITTVVTSNAYGSVTNPSPDANPYVVSFSRTGPGVVSLNFYRVTDDYSGVACTPRRSAVLVGSMTID
jgi:prepilin-type N-terminal cleavage/methylation domain-containing protein